MRARAIVIGAGHAGLAMSRCLTDRSIDHVVLERGEVANSWKHERWDSLRLLTPNWQSRLPGYTYEGPEPDGFRTMPETIDFIERYAQTIDAPILTDTAVTSVRRVDDEYQILTNRGSWRASAVVLATGACNVATVPGAAAAVPSSINTITPIQYRNPDQIAPGGVLVVGASASGLQIAEELHRSGRPVTLSVGEHVRVPRVYRGRDIQWWMDRAGVLDEFYQDADSVDRVRNVPSLQLIGSDERRTVDLNALTDIGVKIVGRLMGIHHGHAQFSGSLRNLCDSADLKMNRLLDRIDQWVAECYGGGEVEPAHRFDPTRVPVSPPVGLDLASGEIETIVWATGYRPDFSWLDVPVFDRKGRVRHDGGIVASPGLYLMGIPFLRRRKSSLIDGAGDDARDLSAHLAGFLAGSGPRRRFRPTPPPTLVPA